MDFTNTKYKIIAIVDNEKYCSDASYWVIREMLEEEYITVNNMRICVNSIEVSKNDEVVYFYGDHHEC
ncbi:hypothetical protein [Bacillus sp. Marseille-P3661]|uniref:hypothetical protein n=1 Tax=Bacillus sp. Marseille-P3661 TaxID=1936234 RepID=UPI000C830D73|nr:hypothetical protein [Bacillus sp. Marseille-P3661]